MQNFDPEFLSQYPKKPLCASTVAVPPVPAQAHLPSGSAGTRGRSLPAPHCGGSGTQGLPCEHRERGDAKGAAQPGRERRGRERRAGSGRAAPLRAPGEAPPDPRPRAGPGASTAAGAAPPGPAGLRGAPAPRDPRSLRVPSAFPRRRRPYRPLGSLGARRGCRGRSGTAAPHRPILPAPRARQRRATAPPPARDCAGRRRADKERRARPGTAAPGHGQGTRRQRYRLVTDTHRHTPPRHRHTASHRLSPGTHRLSPGTHRLTIGTHRLTASHRHTPPHTASPSAHTASAPAHTGTHRLTIGTHRLATDTPPHGLSPGTHRQPRRTNSGERRELSSGGKGRCLINAPERFSYWQRLRELRLFSPTRGGGEGTSSGSICREVSRGWITLCSVLPSTRTRGNGQKLMHREFQPNRKNFCVQ
nr:serine/arginine repetitive matrix protein 3-like [Taeniopygia guttata]